MSESNTPETDDSLIDIGRFETVSADFARRLERERDEALAKLAKLGRMVEIAGAANDAQTEAEVALSATFAEAMAHTDRDMLAAELEEAKKRLTELWTAIGRHGCAGESLMDALNRLRGAADKAQEERDQLRNVADELAYELKDLRLSYVGLGGETVLARIESKIALYNQLPHVVARKEEPK